MPRRTRREGRRTGGAVRPAPGTPEPAPSPVPAPPDGAGAGMVVVRGVRPGGWGPAGPPPMPTDAHGDPPGDEADDELDLDADDGADDVLAFDPTDPDAPRWWRARPSTDRAPVTVTDLFPDGPFLPVAPPAVTAAPSAEVLEQARLAAVSSLDPYEVLERQSHLALQALEADRCNLFRFDDSATNLVLVLSVGRVAGLSLGRWFVHGESLHIGDLASRWGALLHPHVFGITNTDGSPLVPGTVPDEVRAGACLVMPLVVDGEPLGLLTADWAEPRPFADHELARLEAIGGYATVALGQALRHDETQRRHHRADVRRELTHVASGAATLEAAFAQLTRVLAPETGVALLRLAATNPEVRGLVRAREPDRRELHVIRSWRAVLARRDPVRTRPAAERRERDRDRLRRQRRRQPGDTPDDGGSADLDHRLVPVVHHHRVLGVLRVRVDDQRPRPPDEDTLLSLGHALGEALYECRLARARTDAERERLLTGERERIARDLHDSAAQTLAGLGMRISAYRDEVPDNLWGLRLDDFMLLTGQAVHEVRQAIRGLLFPARRHHELAQSLRQLLGGLDATSGLEGRLELEGEPYALTAEAEHALFRLAHEAVTNAERHAEGATEIVIVLRYAADGVWLRVQDDGKGLQGMDPFGQKGHFGLVGVRGRLEELGGDLLVRNAEPGVGVEGRVPARRGRGDGAADSGPGRR